MIWSLILAAGLSRRMGEQKLLLPFGGRSILETVIDRAAGSRADRILVVLGANRERIERQVEPAGVRTVFNPHYKQGMLSSVQCGLGALPDDAEAAVILLGDQPSVEPGTIDALVGAYLESKKGIILPVQAGHRGHPVLIDLGYRDEVKRLDPAIGLRQLIHNHPEDLEEVPVDTPSIHQDIDNCSDYDSELRKRDT